MNKKSMLVSASVVLLLVSGFFGYRAYTNAQAATEDEIQTATVTLGSLTSTLSASGNTRSGQSATIVWQTSGKVSAVTLEPGDLVQEDQVLAELDPSTLSNELIAAEQELIDAQQALDDLLNSTLQQAQALQAVEDAQEALDSLNQTAAEDASQAQLALAEAQEAYDDALSARERMNYPHSSDDLVIEKAETNYLLAKEAYKKALQKYNDLEKKKLTNFKRVNALNELVAAEQAMDQALAVYNWYLLGYTEEEIAQADAELAVAQANLETAQANWDRLQNGTSQAAIALAEATLADAQREWERVKDGPSEEDIAAAQAAVDAAQATLDSAQLLAPFDGTITEVEIKNGDLVSAGDAAFRIDDLTSIYVDLEISEYDLASLAVGQPVTLEFEAIPDKEYTGEVTEIGMIGSVSSGVVNYPVIVRVTNADEDILPGMTAVLSIIIDQVNDVLIVPNKAIHTSSDQQTVTVLFEGQPISVPVTVGLTADSMSAVTSDQLREGDLVLVSGTTASSTSSSSQSASSAGGAGVFGGPPDDFGSGPPAGMP